MSTPDPEAVVMADCGRILARVRELRKFDRPKADAPPPDVHKALVEVRGQLDQMEEMYAQLISMYTAAKIVAAERAADRQKAWDDKATAPARPGAGPEFQGKEERYARWNIDTFAEQRAARQAQRLADFIGGIEKQVSLLYYGMRGLEDTLKTSLKYLPWETSLEREG